MSDTLPRIGSVVCAVTPSRQHPGFYYLTRYRVTEHIGRHHALPLPSPEGDRALHGVVGEVLQTFAFHPGAPEGGRLLPRPVGYGRSDFIEAHELELDLLAGIVPEGQHPQEHHFVQVVWRGGGYA